MLLPATQRLVAENREAEVAPNAIPEEVDDLIQKDVIDTNQVKIREKKGKNWGKIREKAGKIEKKWGKLLKYRENWEKLENVGEN